MLRKAFATLAWAALLLAGAPVGASGPACDLPGDFAQAARPLPALSRALERGPVLILALGSGSITGPGSSGPEAAWPGRLQALLSERYPGRSIEVAVRGGRGVSVTDHLALLRESLANETPALILWQLGTVEAVRGMDPDEMTEALRRGLEHIRRRGADVIVVDQQYSRFLRANSNIEPYREKLRLAAAAAGAALFPRYDLMQHWVETGAVDLERTPRPGRTAAVDKLNDCVARALAELIIRGVAEAR
ncbi:MAG: GDSL-type esterase/lipase family protein [Roseococcus sp.]|nr:GDSL-type esterase/lipase family protein [Roseococcus sp.]